MLLTLVIFFLYILNLKYKITKHMIVIYFISLIHFSVYLFMHVNFYFCSIAHRFLKFIFFNSNLIILCIFIIIFGIDLGKLFLFYHLVIILYLLLVIPSYFAYIYVEKPFLIKRNISIHENEYEHFLKIGVFFLFN